MTPEGYIGVDVHRGARVCALAHGRQIVLSPVTAALLDGEELRDLGAHRLKDFDAAIRLFQLGLDAFPPLRTPGSVELPTPATDFLGRERELFDAVSVVYERDPRVFSVLGPGGTGKTRFALELCRLLAEDADGGTVFCALAPLREPDLVLATIAERLGATSPEVGAISARVGDKRTHVLVDNLEHLLPDAASQLAELIEAAPSLRLVVTSREALRIQGETEFDLPPLSESEAVALFIARARAVRPDLEEDDAVGALCARLDRLPLALELAASRTKLLAPETLLARLGESLDLLKGTRDADERHATLRATIAWSYDLLDDGRAASLPRGSQSSAAAARSRRRKRSAKRISTRSRPFSTRACFRRRTGRLGEERYWMLETIREFAAERLDESTEARRRSPACHAERMLEIAQSAHLTRTTTSRSGCRSSSPRSRTCEQPSTGRPTKTSSSHSNSSSLSRTSGTSTLAEERSAGWIYFHDAGRVPPRLRAAALRVRAVRSTWTATSTAATPVRGEPALFRELGDERGMRGPAPPREQRVSTAANSSDPARYSTSRRSSRRTIPVHRDPRTSPARTDPCHSGDGRQPAPHSFGSPPTWRPTSTGTGGGPALSHPLRYSRSMRGDLDEAEQDSREALQLIATDESRVGTSCQLTRDRSRRVRAETIPAGRRSLGRSRRRDRAIAQSDLGARAPERAGPLLDEATLEFLSSVEIGRQLDLWDAVGIALGELELPQTEP